MNKALALAPDNPEILFRSALVYNRFGDTSNTLAQLKKSVDGGFSRPNIRDTPDFKA